MCDQCFFVLLLCQPVSYEHRAKVISTLMSHDAIFHPRAGSLPVCDINILTFFLHALRSALLWRNRFLKSFAGFHDLLTDGVYDLSFAAARGGI